MSNYHYSRRTFLRQLGWGALGTLTACNLRSPDTSQAVRIGAIYLLTGGFAAYGEFARDGVNLAQEEINAGAELTDARLRLSSPMKKTRYRRRGGWSYKIRWISC